MQKFLLLVLLISCFCKSYHIDASNLTNYKKLEVYGGDPDKMFFIAPTKEQWLSKKPLVILDEDDLVAHKDLIEKIVNTQFEKASDTGRFRGYLRLINQDGSVGFSYGIPYASFVTQVNDQWVKMDSVLYEFYRVVVKTNFKYQKAIDNLRSGSENGSVVIGGNPPKK